MRKYPPESQWLDRVPMETVERYRPGRQISMPEPGDAFGVIEGAVRIVMLAPDGRERPLMELGAGGLFGQQSAPDRASATTNLVAIALTDCAVGYMSGPGIVAAVSQDPSLILAFMQRSAETTSLLLKELERIAFSDSLTLVASILMERSDEAGSLPFSQEHLAQLAGKTRVTVASALHRLQELRTIRLERARIWVIDPDALRRLAQGGEDARAPRL